MAALKDELLSSVGSRRVDLDSDEVKGHEKDQETDEDTEITPDMGPGVFVCNLDEVITRHKCLASNCTLRAADE